MARKKQPPLGSGQRFRTLSNKIQRRSGMSEERADAIAATIGRKKLGAARFNKLAAAGRRRAAAKRRY